MVSLSETFDRLRDWLGLGRPPLHRAIRQAYRRLERMTSSGIAVPADVIQDIMGAAEAERAGTLTPEIEVTFYAAQVRLVRLRRGLTHDDEIQEPFADALSDADLLLKYAAETGHTLPTDIVRPIMQTQIAASAGTMTDVIQADFYAAYGRLSRMFGDVTADTIRACRSEQTRRMLRMNRRLALSLTVGIVIISVAAFVADTLTRSIGDRVTLANQDAVRLRAMLTEPGIRAAVPEGGAQSRPPNQEMWFAMPVAGEGNACQRLSADDGSRHPLTENQIELLQRFTATMRDINSLATKLNWMLGQIEVPPIDSMAIEYHVSARALLEIDPTVLNFTAEVLCKITAYQRVRDFASNVQRNYTAVLGALAAHAFPILYALLGAFAFRLRLFVDTVRSKTYHPSFADSARMITAVIAGAVVGLFSDAANFSLSPLATAFLVGYGVELFFRFLDTLLTAFGSGGGLASRSQRPPG